MNYYQARQRKDKRWDFTCRNDDQIWPVPPCSEHEDGHATADEADRHFYDYEAAHLRDYAIKDALHPCEHPDHKDGEPVWTAKGLQSRHLGEFLLCDEHRTPEGWQAVRPPEPKLGGLYIISSY